MTIHTPVRSIAIAAALGMALGSSALGATVASADTTTTSTTTSAAPKPSNIDFSKTGSITVHKRDLGTATRATPTGNELTNAPGTALEGATFALYKVNADLTTNAGFSAAAKLTPATATYNAAPVATGTSDRNGLIPFSNLPVGVYFLRETGAPAGYSPSADSLVFIPMTNPSDTSAWNYNVHVYPKNVKNEVVKEVKDANANVGDNIVYTIKSDIPQVISPTSSTTTISKYTVNDDLDENRLDSPTVTVGLSGGTTFTAGATNDYTLVIDPTTLKVTVDFTQAGRVKLTAAKATNGSVKVVTTLTSKVKVVGDTSPIVNNATTITNNGGGGGDTTTTSNPVTSYYGKLKVVKFDKDDATKLLEGATFQLYVCTDQDNLSGNALTVNGQSSWPTAADGTVTINGLHVTDFVDNAALDATAVKKYCLVETKAPAGYELLPKPVVVSFTRADIAATGTGDDAVTLVSKVENVKSVTPQLPLTGGAGIGILAAVGALIVGAGAWTARRLSRS